MHQNTAHSPSVAQHHHVELATAGGASFAAADRLWIYVPTQPMYANSDFPICQTYVDTVLQVLLSATGAAGAA